VASSEPRSVTIVLPPPMTTDKRQRKKDARRQRLETERKAASRRELRRRLLAGFGIGALVIGVLVVFSRGDDGDLPGTYEAFRNQPTACGAEQPPAQQIQTFSEPADMGIGPDDAVTATLVTSCGEIVLELDPASSPATVNSFVFLAEQGFYDGTVFHRILADFVVQGGDPQADGQGGPGYRVPDEFPEAGFTYEPGVVAMANAGRGTTGSQFFVVTGPDAAFLGPTFNVLGRVVEGDDVLDLIEAVPTRQAPGSQERSLPLETVYLERVEITRP
jgi:cyclophilin family peptidyl-prolyl cis-trans isomerase